MKLMWTQVQACPGRPIILRRWFNFQQNTTLRRNRLSANHAD